MSFLYFWFAVVAVAAVKERRAEDVESAFVTFFVAAVVAAMRTVPVLTLDEKTDLPKFAG